MVKPAQDSDLGVVEWRDCGNFAMAKEIIFRIADEFRACSRLRHKVTFWNPLNLVAQLLITEATEYVYCSFYITCWMLTSSYVHLLAETFPSVCGDVVAWHSRSDISARDIAGNNQYSSGHFRQGWELSRLIGSCSWSYCILVFYDF